VPNLAGQRFGPAVRRLETAGLRANVVYATSTRPRGAVTAQQPAAGTRVRRGSRVRLTVSAGANPTLQAVPDVVGQDQNSAVTALRQAGFTPVVVRRVVTNSSQDGMVIEQQPAAGRQAPRGGSVAIYVGTTG
jgi:serine/threonine-protein kinase